MHETRTVIVYNFRVRSGHAESASQARYKSTRERIATWPGAELLEGTGERVPVSALDDEGRYRRVATAWGEL